ncbi:MAG TPA: protein kinase [Caulobacteraceae bacterium]|nr:protein kinase [Caulobacteraceae bacterium]
MTDDASISGLKTPHRLAVGAMLNQIYEVRRYIGRGGMGEVYEGVNLTTGERVAIKVILPHLADDPQAMSLFLREARVLIGLNHPALAMYRMATREPSLGVLYIVTEFIDGVSLEQMLGSAGIGEDQALGLARRLAEGLRSAHAAGAVHRDISPDNILAPDGRLEACKIIDFGIAREAQAGDATLMGGGFVGKLGYAAPEQFGDFDGRIGPWTDVYSLGLVLLAIALGAPADMGETVRDAIERRRTGPDLSGAPPRLRRLLEDMLQADPTRRLRGMEAVLSRLDEISRSTPQQKDESRAGVFLSYSRADRALADQLLAGLRSLGVEVWWDEDMPGVDWQQELERQINALAAVVVIWTPTSRNSKNVRDEARLALAADKLINVLCGAAQPPFPFDRVNGLALDGWTGREPHRGWSRLVQTVEALLVARGAAPAGAVVGALERQESEVRRLGRAVEAAETEFQQAQALEAEASREDQAAAAALARAEEQLRRVLEMGGARLILEGAQQEVQNARNAHGETAQRLRQARGAMSEASRLLAAARNDFERLFADSAPPTPPALRRPQAPVDTVVAPLTSATSQRPSRSRGPRAFPVAPIVGLAVAAALAVGATGLVVSGALRPTAEPALAIRPAPVAPPQVPAPAGPDRGAAGPSGAPGTSSAAPELAQRLNGEWAPAGLGCGDRAERVRISIQSGVLTLRMGGETVSALTTAASDNHLSARGDDGAYAYDLDAAGLRVDGPDGSQQRLVRCGR